MGLKVQSASPITDGKISSNLRPLKSERRRGRKGRGSTFSPPPLNNFLPVDQMAESVGGGGVDRLFWVGAIYRADPSNRMDRPETPVYKRAHDHPRWHRGARDRDNCPCLRRFGRQRAERGSLMREGLGEYCYRSIF